MIRYGPFIVLQISVEVLGVTEGMSVKFQSIFPFALVSESTISGPKVGTLQRLNDQVLIFSYILRLGIHIFLYASGHTTVDTREGQG